MKKHLLALAVLANLGGCAVMETASVGQSNVDWASSIVSSENVEIKDGKASLVGESGTLSTVVYKSSTKTRLDQIEISQVPVWDNWQAAGKITPKFAKDAPVLIPVSEGNYWLLSRHKKQPKTGYHAWHTTDMKNWVHYGPISNHDNRWVTSAEYMDGKFYIYFDKPNDEDPHLIIDEDLTDGKQGKVVGKVFEDPTHGSDMSIFRDDDGLFHLIYEDWSPVDPSKHAWDSPLAGHADSPDGINGFEPHEYVAPIDQRTTATGRILPYKPHPNQLEFGRDPTPYTYEEHEGPQDAFGDYTMIKVGGHYYLFCDYDPHDENKSMRVGRWRTDDITKEFVWDGEVGEGFHPDPTVGFAEGKFYLLVQRSGTDFISDGPWIDGVNVRAGVDTDNDGKVDQWTPFTKVKETYKAKEGFTRVVESTPAALDVSSLPAGYQVTLEFKLSKHNDQSPTINGVKVTAL
ncbi:hypothetical protein Q4575_18040 [Psychrosphaera sp. 1_MG-2023]|uniref:hypothetical protein n=1 Tax=Psychrosphaera sp. 1_MG-2023 TaxID=3062643 RepID=UPI0026E1DDE3|nr:hypothetical protein [Psychrosphaera sp. 1_MG-2023]MDO6721315.1 hypothetical protein [Psychrosphaera sp. 1_MG-2023]